MNQLELFFDFMVDPINQDTVKLIIHGFNKNYPKFYNKFTCKLKGDKIVFKFSYYDLGNFVVELGQDGVSIFPPTRKVI